MIRVRAAVLTPLGDLEATLEVITRGTIGEARDPQTGLIMARLTAKPTSARRARLVGPLPVLALELAQTIASDLPRGARTGVFVATGGLRAQWDELAPAMAEQVADGTAAWARGLSRMHPLWMLRYLPNAAHAIIAAELGAIGDGATFAGPASAASALCAAQAAFEAHAIDHAIIVALDDVTADEVAIELASRKPGVIPGAGAAVLVVARTDAHAAGFAAAHSAAPAAAPVGADADDSPRAGQQRAVGRCPIHVEASDGVDPEHAEPSSAAIRGVRDRLGRADRDVSFARFTGWLGAATLLVDAILGSELMCRGFPRHLDLGAPRAITTTAAASPGQIGVIWIGASRGGTRE